MKITDLHALEILDSRGNPTIKVTATIGNGAVGAFSVPSGASTGQHEAVELRDGDKTRYGGRGVLHAVANVNGPIANLLKGNKFADQAAVDLALIELDGTPNKARLGANAILGASIAVAKAAAAAEKLPFYRYLAKKQEPLLPCPMMNILNGGMHADNPLDFQEFMIRPIGAPSFTEAVRWGAEIFHALRSLLKKRGLSTAVGDEGGFAPALNSNEEALELILESIRQAGFREKSDITLALDVAASEFYEKDFYWERKKGPSGVKRSSAEQVHYLEKLVHHYPIDSIEDGLDQNDWEGWRLLTEKLGSKIQLVGDDLFVTNPRFLRRGIDTQTANAILVKVNQIGTLTETLATVGLAQANNYATIISHRSGETEDSTIADLCVALRSGQIKTGSLSRSDRTAKYNRLLEIEAEIS